MKESEIKKVVGHIFFLYNLLLYQDGKLDNREANTLFTKLQKLVPDIDVDYLKKLDAKIKREIKNSDFNVVLFNTMSYLKKNITEQGKLMIIKDMIDIALADDDFDEKEISFINILVDFWKLSDKINVNKIANEKIYKSKNTNKTVIDNQPKDISSWNIFHDIILIYVLLIDASQSKEDEDRRNEFWSEAYMLLTSLEFKIQNKIVSISNYNSDEFVNLTKFVVDKIWGDNYSKEVVNENLAISFNNLINYAKEGVFKDEQIRLIVKSLFDSVVVEKIITDSQKRLIDLIIDSLIEYSPSIQVFKDMLEMKMLSQEIEQDLKRANPDIEINSIITIDKETGQMKVKLPFGEEI